MHRNWDRFEGRQNGRTAKGEPRVTLGAKSVFYLNGTAFDLLEQPVAVEMLFDSNNRVLG